MFISTLPKNIFRNPKKELLLEDNTIGNQFLENKILRDYLEQEIKASNIDNDTMISSVLQICLKFGCHEFNLLKKSEELARLLKDASSMSLNYSIYPSVDSFKFVLFSRFIQYNNELFPMKTFFFDGQSNTKYYDSRSYSFKEDFYKNKVNFKTGNIVKNILDFREYYVAKDPKTYSVYECLIPVDTTIDNRFYILSWGAFILIDDNRYHNIREYTNKLAKEKNDDKQYNP